MLFTFNIEDFNLNKFEKIAIDYLNKNKNAFLQEYTTNINPIDEKIAIFTAGMSGVGKTELSIFFKETNPNFLHIDTDNIRDFLNLLGMMDKIQIYSKKLQAEDSMNFLITL